MAAYKLFARITRKIEGNPYTKLNKKDWDPLLPENSRENKDLFKIKAFEEDEKIRIETAKDNWMDKCLSSFENLSSENEFSINRAKLCRAELKEAKLDALIQDAQEKKGNSPEAIRRRIYEQIYGVSDH